MDSKVYIIQDHFQRHILNFFCGNAGSEEMKDLAGLLDEQT